ncbi:hypothetical protein [Methyloceanibacter sp. wino2]|uniref:hypothetical protein n=1 Tax=Methyloceanibacter sp. wino2 TaxID=2170729 RepID=UPI00131ED72B|nr:hypothetical protein [Methyloceanibacter sp. wino2]
MSTELMGYPAYKTLGPEKEKDAQGAEISSALDIPNPVVKPESFRKSERRRRSGSAIPVLAELQRLNNNGLLVVAEATAERNGSCNEHDSGDNALQTLHGLLSFG